MSLYTAFFCAKYANACCIIRKLVLALRVIKLFVFSNHTATFVLPFSVHIAMLGVLMLLNGLALGSLDNG